MKTTPLQKRSISRVTEILTAAEELIQELPIDDITSTMIAKRANVTRTSLYHFFPSKFDIYDALSKKYRSELKEEVIRFFDPDQQTDYREAWDGIAGVFSRFFNRKPTAAILLLGRKASRQIRYTDEAGSQGFAKELSKLMREHTDLRTYAADLDASGDIFQIVLELLTATFAYGMRREGRISKKTREEAKAATLAYINTCLQSEAS
jgi:AcrR family transcriptional regulator